MAAPGGTSGGAHDEPEHDSLPTASLAASFDVVQTSLGLAAMESGAGVSVVSPSELFGRLGKPAGASVPATGKSTGAGKSTGSGKLAGGKAASGGAGSGTGSGR